MRVTNWREELDAVFAAAHGRKFRWGYHDCLQHAARCVAAVTGYDARILFPRYQTKTEADAILEREGGIRALIIRALGEPVHVSRAGVGDVVLFSLPHGLQPAVCMGLESFAPGRRRLVPYKTATAIDAWVI